MQSTSPREPSWTSLRHQRSRETFQLTDRASLLLYSTQQHQQPTLLIGISTQPVTLLYIATSATNTPHRHQHSTSHFTLHSNISNQHSSSASALTTKATNMQVPKSRWPARIKVTWYTRGYQVTMARMLTAILAIIRSASGIQRTVLLHCSEVHF